MPRAQQVRTISPNCSTVNSREWNGANRRTWLCEYKYHRRDRSTDYSVLLWYDIKITRQFLLIGMAFVGRSMCQRKRAEVLGANFSVAAAS